MSENDFSVELLAKEDVYKANRSKQIDRFEKFVQNSYATLEKGLCIILGRLPRATIFSLNNTAAKVFPIELVVEGSYNRTASSVGLSC